MTDLRALLLALFFAIGDVIVALSTWSWPRWIAARAAWEVVRET